VYSLLGLGESSGNGGSYLLLPNRVLLARWRERDPQSVAGSNAAQFRTVGSEEQFSDPRYFFHFRSSSEPAPNSCLRRARRDHWSYG
jgi:hypothetical protein